MLVMAADALHRADEVDEIGDVVWPHVEDRAAAGQEEEVGIGMPHFHARPHDIAGAGGDAADAASVDVVAGKLVRAAEEGIRRAAHRKALFAGDAA